MGTNFSRKLIILLTFTLLFCSNSFLNGSTQNNSQKHLYPGEEIVFANNYPSLIKFINGNPNKPLVVFNPGFAFSARITKKEICINDYMNAMDGIYSTSVSLATLDEAPPDIQGSR